MLARSKSNSIERKISEALINNEISYENFTTIISEEKTFLNLRKALEWWKLKEVILKEKIWLKKIKEKTLIKLLDKMHNYKTRLYYCLKCRKNTEKINLKISGTSNSKTMTLSNYDSKKSKFLKKIRSKWIIEQFRN